MRALRDTLALVGVTSPDTWTAAFAPGFLSARIDTPRRQAGFLANVLEETDNLATLRESMNYSVAGLLATFPSRITAAQASKLGRAPLLLGRVRPADQRGIAELVYGNRLGNGPAGSGDGWTFRGAGGLQTTGRANYVAFAKVIGWTLPLEQLPDHLATVQGAADSAVAFWNANGCNLLADAGNVLGLRQRINGGTNGLASVQARYSRLLTLLGVLTPSPAPPDDATDALNLVSLANARNTT